MNKNIIRNGLLAAVFMAMATCAMAQEQRETGQSTQASQFGKIQDGLLMRDGTVYFIKNGQAQRIERETRLSEGIVIDENGNLTLKDGTKTKLSDNQMVTLDGQLKIVPPSVGATSPSPSPTPTRSGREL